MSDSVRPHRRQPTRLPRPWDSSGKNTGVRCHCPLQCRKAKSESEVSQSCPTPSDPMDCSPPGPSIHGIFQARVLEWVVQAIVISCSDYCNFLNSASGPSQSMFHREIRVLSLKFKWYHIFAQNALMASVVVYKHCLPIFFQSPHIKRWW